MTPNVALGISQFLDAWRIFGRACPGSRVESHAGVDYMFTGLPIAFFNVAVLTSDRLSAVALDASARGAMQWASDKNAPWLFIVTHEALEPGTDAAAILDACGLGPLLPMTGRLARGVSPAATVPAGAGAADDRCSANARGESRTSRQAATQAFITDSPRSGSPRSARR